MWHITDACPLACPFCFATKTRDFVAREDVDAYMPVFHALGVQKVDIAGGEPLVSPAVSAVSDALARNAIYQTITTSGAGSEAARNWVVNVSSRFTRVIVSLDGPETLHDQ